MCELFGVSGSVPVQVKYSLHAFAEHGGLIHPNKSGWGIAYHEGRDALLIKEPDPASESPWVRFIESQPLISTCVIAHVRYATAGAPSFANTHPFMRELGGRMHLFAHNGGFDGIWDKKTLRSGVYHPTGQTDSEFAFCLLLERLAPLWRGAEGAPPLADRLAMVAEVAGELASMGSANFLYSDGDVLFAHAHKRHWDEGGGNFSEARPPGLSLARQSDLSVKGLRVEAPDPDTMVVYLASVPLTGDAWEPLPEGTVIALRDGVEVSRIKSS
jgi:glutamine amidotransferase